MRVNYQNLAITAFNGLYRGIGQSWFHTVSLLKESHDVEPYLLNLTGSTAPFKETLKVAGMDVGAVTGYVPWTDILRLKDEYIPDMFVPNGIMHSWDNFPMRTRCPQVVTVHDMFLFSRKYRKYIAKENYPLDNDLRRFEFADVVVCPSAFSLKDFEEECPWFKGYKRVIPWGSKFSHVSVDISYVSDSVRDSADKPFVLWVSAPEKRKNFKLFCDVVGQLQGSVKGVVVGGMASLAKEDVDVATGLLSKGTIMFLENLNDSELCYLYSRAEALLCTSDFEGFGMPAVEAASLNCPVVVRNASSLAEFEFALKAGAEAEEWVVQVKKILQDAEFRRALGCNGRMATDGYFNYNNTAKQYNAIYEELSA